jgi:manganese/zinc/iron transport system substrate-binding protein
MSLPHRGRRWFLGVIASGVAGLLLSGCSEAPADTGPRKYPYEVLTTVGMVNDIVRNVAGDKANVRAIMGAGVDPHLYKPTRDDVAAMTRADVVFYSGLMLEGKMADTLVRVGRSKPVYAVTEIIDEKSLLKPDEFGGHYDPHVWMDASAWGLCATAVGKSLAEYDPANAPLYLKNAADYAARCAALHEYGKKAVATIPPNSRVLITSHDAFNYFGRAYGLEVLGVQGLSTESEAGLQRINELVDRLVKSNIKAVFVESSVSQKNIRALIEGARSRGHEVKIGGELFSDAMGPDGTYEGTYLGMIDHNITLVTRGLGGEAPQRGMADRLASHGG